MKRRVIVVGGGASGLAAGICAAGQGASVTVLEHMDRVGKKLLSTGNGKCNLTNMKMDGDCYRSDNDAFPMEVIGAYPVEKTLDFFTGLGILPKSKNGYVYPNSEQASSVLDVLRLEAAKRRVGIECGCHVTEIRHENGIFEAVSDGGAYTAESLILSTGSMAAPSAGSDGSGYILASRLGHRVIKPLPALVQLCCQGKFFRHLAGIRTEADLSLEIDGKVTARENGELQLTEYGISGIPTFQISRYASKALDSGRSVSVHIDFMPGRSRKQVREFLMDRLKSLGDRTGEEFLLGVLNRKLAVVLLKESGIPLSEPVAGKGVAAMERLLLRIKDFKVIVTSTKPFSNAQVCVGGVDTLEVLAPSMESKLLKGLYLTGELLDVDGICGGYNLQWAWSTGCLAGIHAGGGKI